jgi:hypothetical protein
MAKKVTVEVEVNSSQVDQTVQKLGQLKDLGRGLKIQYDIDGKPIDIAIDKSLNLQKQVRILTAELRRTKEGTAEFQLLSSRLGQAQDELAKTTAKSKDLFSSLSLLPGPIGQFFSQLNGAVGLLKTFSSFSLKDLRFQLKESVDDLKDIRDGFSGINDGVKSTTDTTNESVNAFREQGDTIASVIDESKSLVDQFDLQKAAVKKISDLTGEGKLINQQYATGLVKNAETGELVAGVINKQTNATRVLTQAELQLVASGKAVTLTTEGMIVAEGAATVATFTLAGAVKALGIALGIGGLILILTFVADKLIEVGKYLLDFVTGTLAAEEATKKLSKSLDELDSSYEKSNKSLKRATNERIALLKSQGATEEQIRKATIEGLISERDITSKTLGETVEIIKKLQKNRGKNDEENNKEIERALKKKKDLEEQYKDQSSNIRIAELNNITENNKKKKESDDKAAENYKKAKEKEIEDTKAANELLLKLQQENATQRLDTERKREDQQLKNEKINEEKSINNLKISEELKGKLLEQVRFKYGLKVIELNKKRQAEDNKTFEEEQQKVKEYNDKIFEIMNNADENELSRNKATRTRKFEDDKKALEKDTNFQKETLENKIRILLALEKGYKNDLEKLDSEELAKNRESALKKLDDELRFLQIRGEAIIQGTREYFDNLRAISKKAEERELKDLENRAITEKLTTEQVEKEKTEIKKKYAKERTDIDKQELNSYLQFATSILGAAQNIVSNISEINQMQQDIDLQKAEGNAEKQEEIKKKYFEKNKKTQIAQAIIGTLQGAVQAYQSLAVIPVVGPALGAAAAAAALIFGYKKVDLIRQQQYQSSSAGGSAEAAKPQLPNFGRNYEKGGMIGGKRHAEGGTLIEAEKGEAIMTRGAVTMFAPLLSAMNQMGGGTSFVPSLVTTSFDAPITSKPSQEQAPIIVKSYVVSSELTSEQNKQARLKDLSTL